MNSSGLDNMRAYEKETPLHQTGSDDKSEMWPIQHIKTVGKWSDWKS